jgi:hypothetical protein
MDLQAVCTYLCGEQQCTMKLHDAWQQHCTLFCKLNLHSNRQVQWPVYSYSCSFSILKLDGMSINDMHDVGICCVYVSKYVTFCCFSGKSHPLEAPSKFALLLCLSACMFDIGELCDEIFKLFQFTLNWMILTRTFHAHTHAHTHTVVSLLCPHIPFMSHAIVALLLGHEKISYLEQ